MVMGVGLVSPSRSESAFAGLRTHLYQFNCVSTASPAVNWGARNAMACPGVMSPRARGRVLVRSVFVGTSVGVGHA